MSSTFAIVLAAKLVGSVLAVADTGLPQFNPATGCKAALAINQSIDLIGSQTYEDCIADEESAKARNCSRAGQSTRRPTRDAASRKPRMVACRVT